MSKPLSRREFKEFRRTQRQALKLQAREYERRLKHLNGEQKRIAAAAAVSVRKDLYESDKDGMDARIDALRAAEDKRIGALRLIGLLAAGGAVTGVIGLVGFIVQAIRVPAPAPSPQVYYVPALPGAMLPSTGQQK